MKFRELLYKVKRRLYFLNVKNTYYKYQLFREYDLKKLRKKYDYVLEKVNLIDPKDYEYSNKVFICWLQGEENAPIIVKKCIESLRSNLKDREIVIITEQNYSDYVSIPQYIIEKYKKGIIPTANFSDILRLELLIKYGGTWIDSTVLCTSNKNIEQFFDCPLFVFKNVVLGTEFDLATKASNWFITSSKKNNILVLTRALIYEYWKRENILKNYYIFHIFFKMATEKCKEEWNKVPTYSNINPHILQFELLEEYSNKRFEQIKTISQFHKLNRRIENTNLNRNTFYDYIVSDKK